MDLKAYFDDMHKAEADLDKRFPSGMVYVTSLFHRERNSTPGTTISATCRNAARVITDGTHREATQEEIDGFLKRQQDELRKNAKSEQKNKQQYIVVVDQKTDGLEPVFAGGVAPGEPAPIGKGRQGAGKD